MTLTYTDGTESLATVDHRRETRVSRETPLRVFEPGTGRMLEAVTENVSGHGLCLRLEASVSLRSGRLLTVYGMPAAGPRLADPSRHAVPARVVWTRPDPADNATLLVGVRLCASGLAAAA